MKVTVTPACKAKYLWLFKPNVKFDAQGTYSITCIAPTDDKEWHDLIAELQSDFDDYYDSQCKGTRKKLKKCPYYPWKSEEDGTRVFVAKNKAIGTKKDGTTWDTKIHVCNAEREELTQDNLKGPLGEGTEVRVGFEPNFWMNDAQGCGISARLKFVQILKPAYIERFQGFDLLESSPVDRTLFTDHSKKTTEYEGMEIEDLFANSPIG